MSRLFDTVVGDRLAIFSMLQIRKTGQSITAIKAYHSEKKSGQDLSQNFEKNPQTGPSLVGQSFAHDCNRKRTTGPSSSSLLLVWLSRILALSINYNRRLPKLDPMLTNN